MSKQAHLCLPPLPPKECPTFFHVTPVPNFTPPRMLCPDPNLQPISRSTMLHVDTGVPGPATCLHLDAALAATNPCWPTCLYLPHPCIPHTQSALITQLRSNHRPPKNPGINSPPALLNAQLCDQPAASWPPWLPRLGLSSLTCSQVPALAPSSPEPRSLAACSSFLTTQTSTACSEGLLVPCPLLHQPGVRNPQNQAPNSRGSVGLGP